MSIAILLTALLTFQSHPADAPKFGSAAPKIQVPIAPATPPKLDAPKGYRSVQVPDYVAETYMRFASAETAHDYQIVSIDSRVTSLESNREKQDRPDIDSLKETRTKALIYLAIGSTLVSVVWGLLAALVGYSFKEWIWPRIRALWSALGMHSVAAPHGTYSPDVIALAAAEDNGAASNGSNQNDQSKP